MKKIILTCAIMFLNVELTICSVDKGQDITYTEVLNWINTEEYPTKMFGDLETKGFLFERNRQYGNCTGYVYASNKNSENYRCYLTSFICESTSTAYLPIEVTRRFEIQAHINGKVIYDYLAEKIKQYCSLVKTIDSEDSGMSSKTYIYKNATGIYFTFHSLFTQGKMVYYIMVEKSK